MKYSRSQAPYNAKRVTIEKINEHICRTCGQAKPGASAEVKEPVVDNVTLCIFKILTTSALCFRIRNPQGNQLVAAKAPSYIATA